MGLFKKKKPQKSKDYDILSGSGLISFVKSNLKNPSEENVLKAVQALAKYDEDQTHLTKDGELPWGWLSTNMPICRPYEDEMVQIATATKTMEGKEKIAQLEKLIAHYYKYKAFCYSKDECYIKYFSDMWEHCFNSRCKDFEYIKPYEEELKKLKSAK